MKTDFENTGKFFGILLGALAIIAVIGGITVHGFATNETRVEDSWVEVINSYNSGVVAVENLLEQKEVQTNFGELIPEWKNSLKEVKAFEISKNIHDIEVPNFEEFMNLQARFEKKLRPLITFLTDNKEGSSDFFSCKKQFQDAQFEILQSIADFLEKVGDFNEFMEGSWVGPAQGYKAFPDFKF